jgi:hypothetical protein
LLCGFFFAALRLCVSMRGIKEASQAETEKLNQPTITESRPVASSFEILDSSSAVSALTSAFSLRLLLSDVVLTAEER